jgi:hypothetical protein
VDKSQSDLGDGSSARVGALYGAAGQGFVEPDGDRRPVRIGYIIGVASQYRDVMPPDLHRRLCEVALPGEEPEDITFAAGAKALRARYNDINEKTPHQGKRAAVRGPVGAVTPAWSRILSGESAGPTGDIKEIWNRVLG